MVQSYLKLITGSLYRTPLRLSETADNPNDQLAHRHSWDLGYHHAKRGKLPEPRNPAVVDPDAYMDGYATSVHEIASSAPEKETTSQVPVGRTSGHFVSSPEPQAERPEQDIDPAMRLSLHDVPKTVNQVTKAVREAGGRALLIGGAVRDKLTSEIHGTGKSPKDFDIEVYGLHPDKLERVLGTLGQVDAVGKSFGVLKIVIGDDDFDVSVPRRESKTGQGHKGFIPVPDPTMTIKEAARRRDFTMNTVAMDPDTGDVFDPYNGVEDIKNKVLRATDPTAFVEDPLRILRGAQFAARMGMTVDPHTMQLMQQASSELAALPKERVGAEWRKLLMKGEKPSIGLDVMKESGALKVLHPSLDAMSDTEQDPAWHPEGNVWNHTKMVTDRAAEITKDLPTEMKEVVRYAALMHDIAKPSMTTHDPDGHIRSRGHEEAGGKLIDEMFRNQFDVSKLLAEKVAKITTDHIKPQIFYLDRKNLTDGAIRRLAKRLYPATIEELVHVAHADHTGRGPQGDQDFPAGKWLLQKAKELQVDKEPPQKILMGRHLLALGVKPGPSMGRILQQVFDMQVDGQVKNLPDAIRAARGIIGEAPSP